jgi:hypothetical protein
MCTPCTTRPAAVAHSGRLAQSSMHHSPLHTVAGWHATPAGRIQGRGALRSTDSHIQRGGQVHQVCLCGVKQACLRPHPQLYRVAVPIPTTGTGHGMRYKAGLGEQHVTTRSQCGQLPGGPVTIHCHPRLGTCAERVGRQEQSEPKSHDTFTHAPPPPPTPTHTSRC